MPEGSTTWITYNRYLIPVRAPSCVWAAVYSPGSWDGYPDGYMDCKSQGRYLSKSAEQSSEPGCGLKTVTLLFLTLIYYHDISLQWDLFNLFELCCVIMEMYRETWLSKTLRKMHWGHYFYLLIVIHHLSMSLRYLQLATLAVYKCKIKANITAKWTIKCLLALDAPQVLCILFATSRCKVC